MAMTNAELLRHLEAVRAGNPDGLLSPEAVVEAARPESHPMHQRFEWDDSIAGHQYRLGQAREMIRTVTVTIERPAPSDPVVTHAYVSLMQDRREEGGYRETVAVLADEDLRRVMLAEAMGDLRAWRKRYESFIDASDALRNATDQLVLAVTAAAE